MFNNGATTLMYHSLHNGRQEYEAMDPVDRPYSLSTTSFRQHLEHLVSNNIPVLDARDVAHHPAKALAQKHSVLLTFDDGHRSVHTHALPILQEYGLNAFVFLTTDKIATDPQFLDWNDVNALLRAGCVMGGHGTSHQFLDEMNARQVHNELSSSRKIIGDHTGVPTLTMSLPGGRYNRGVLSECHKTGYQVVFTSEVRGPILSTAPILAGRFAIRHEIPLAEFHLMISGKPVYALKKRSVQLAKKGLQKLIGNDRYYRIYRKLAARR
jgi:peptidoglycan/xylan/chitin deacetylase (PgdA/CDA1 family)